MLAYLDDVTGQIANLMKETKMTEVRNMLMFRFAQDKSEALEIAQKIGQ